SQSQARMTSRLCSITTSECPAAINWRKAESSFATSSKCRPVVGSSKRKSFPLVPSFPRTRESRGLPRRWAPAFAGATEFASTRCPASFSRCASPPESVGTGRSEEHTSELQSRGHLVCRLLLEKKKKQVVTHHTTLID